MGSVSGIFIAFFDTIESAYVGFPMICNHSFFGNTDISAESLTFSLSSDERMPIVLENRLSSFLRACVPYVIQTLPVLTRGNIKVWGRQYVNRMLADRFEDLKNHFANFD
jgi:hypothetical protein